MAVSTFPRATQRGRTERPLPVRTDERRRFDCQDRAEGACSSSSGRSRPAAPESDSERKSQQRARGKAPTMGDRFSLAVPAAASIKAMEDAKKAQAAIAALCAETGQAAPPYELSELIGKGSFGRVYKAVDKTSADERVVAVKIINIEEGDALGPGGAVDTFGDIMKEVNTLKLLGQAGARNINVVLDSLLVGQSVWIVTEHCAGGSVSTLMRPTGFLMERWIIPILREVAEAVFWVHRQGIIHRDIKCANVLITAAGGIQLCDFGVAGIVESKFDKRKTVTGTLHWMAPELFNQNVSYGTEVDIWAFGSMAFEVASGLPPNARVAIDPSDFGSYLGQHSPRLEGSQYSGALKDLVAFCLVADPSQRPSIEQVQRHPYLANTAAAYPTESLSTLMAAYRLWQSRGGGRLSLFSAGGAQGAAGLEPIQRSPDWDFEDADGDGDAAWFAPDDAADAQTVYAAYGLPVDGTASTTDSEPAESGTTLSRRRRRRPPPNIQRLEVPLEKVFNPNTLTSYQDNARAMYGRGGFLAASLSPQTTSGLPLREDAKYAVRESLIDLDASLVPNDEETIRGPRRGSVSLDLTRRRTQDWTFPTATPLASSTSDVVPAMPAFDWASDHEYDRPPRSARLTQEWTFPTAEELSEGNGSGSYSQTRKSIHLDMPASPTNRNSTLSLIDLDMSIVDEEPRRPSTALSEDTATGSETEDAPFGLDYRSHVVAPSRADTDADDHYREPSMYVPDGIGFLAAEPPSEDDQYGDEGRDRDRSRSRNQSRSRSRGRGRGQRGSMMVPQLAEAPEFAAPHMMPLPLAPRPPSSQVLEGMAARDDIKDELLRLLDSFSTHLQMATHTLERLPVRTARRSVTELDMTLG